MRSEVVLVTCVYEKLTVPAAARDLYTGPYFDRLRRYAEAQAVPWFIISAEHGLVRPTDWLAPYDTDLNAQTPQYRSAWGAWIVAKLDRLVGGVERKTVEIHASPTYIEPIAAELSRLHATLVIPLADVDWDDHHAWYDEQLDDRSTMTPCRNTPVDRINDIGRAPDAGPIGRGPSTCQR